MSTVVNWEFVSKITDLRMKEIIVVIVIVYTQTWRLVFLHLIYMHHVFDTSIPAVENHDILSVLVEKGISLSTRDLFRTAHSPRATRHKVHYSY